MRSAYYNGKSVYDIKLKIKRNMFRRVSRILNKHMTKWAVFHRRQRGRKAQRQRPRCCDAEWSLPLECWCSVYTVSGGAWSFMASMEKEPTGVHLAWWTTEITQSKNSYVGDNSAQKSGLGVSWGRCDWDVPISRRKIILSWVRHEVSCLLSLSRFSQQ